MSGIEVFYLLLLVVCFGTLAGYAYKEYKKSRLKRNQYKLYEIRDNLISLVASGDLEEENVIFQEFYTWVNTWIHSVEELDLVLLFRAFREARRDIERKNKIEILQKALANSDQRVKKTIQKLFTAVLGIMIENSFTLRFVVKHVLTAKSLKRIARVLYHSTIIPKSGKQIYEDYVGYENIRTRIAYVR